MTESDLCIFYFSLKGNTPINKISSSDGFFLVFGKLIHIVLTERNFTNSLDLLQNHVGVLVR